MRKTTSKFRIGSLLMVFSIIFWFSGNSFGGGPEDPACQNLPDPNSGKFLKGEFTVARDKGSCSVENPELCAHYNVHILLKSGNQKHLFSLSSALGSGDLCLYTSEEVKELFARAPCSMAIEEAFGFLGTPVIYKLNIEVQDFCGTFDEMIAGEIVLRVVP